MHYELATVPLLPPLVAFSRRTPWVDVILFTPGIDLDDEAVRAIAKDMIAEMDLTGGTRAWRASAP
jgi:hypothetical protein